MKDFDPPSICITQEEYDQLKKCKSIVNAMWLQFGPHSWPADFNLPKGKSWYDYDPNGEEAKFYKIRFMMDELFNYDDSE